MVQPINYSVDVPDPSQSFLSAFKTGSAITESRMAQEQAQRQMEQQQTMKEAFERLRQPGATAKDYADLAMLLPDTQAKAVRESFSLISGERQQAALQQSGQVFSAFKSGNPDIAIGLLDKQIEAKRNAGDEEGAKFLETWRDVAKTNPKATEDYFGFTISQMPGGKEIIDSAINLSKEKREEAAAPSALTEAKAKADKAVADATTAQATATNAAEKALADAAKATADAKKAEVDAKYAEKIALEDMKKKAADLNLTKAQINKIGVEVRNLNDTGRLLRLDFEAAKKGLPLPSKKTEGGKSTATEDERKAAGWLSQATNAYSNMLAAMYTKEGKPTGAEKQGFGEVIGFGGFARGPERQKFVQASSSLSEALLRAATGAGVNEAEAKQKIEELTPVYSDKKENIDQKLKAIPIYLESLKTRAGRAAPDQNKNVTVDY